LYEQKLEAALRAGRDGDKPLADMPRKPNP
jgi:hypothetical protein